MEGLMDLEKTGPGINFIPCISWVRRGVAKPNPERVKLTTEELSAVIQQTQKDIKELEEVEQEEGKENVEGGVKVKEEEGGKKEKTEEDITAEYGLEDYDEEEEGGEAPLLGLGDLTSFANPADDPYLSSMDRDAGEEDEEDREDFMIRGTDNLLLAGHVEGDSSTLEVYVYNDVEDALYIHHDIQLPSFPMALEWLAFDPESDTRGSLVAVGTMEPVIEVWDLDLVDCLEPAFRLGRKAKKKKKLAGVGHTNAVLALNWNRQCEHVLASGSVDETVLLWDLNTQGVVSSLGHGEKVQSIAFHPAEAQSLLTGCCDSLVRLFDCRAPDSASSWRVTGEVERVVWDHFNPSLCLASTEAGTVHCIDRRKPGETVWTLSAHTEAVTGLSLSSQCPGLLTTVSQDKTMKIWDISGLTPVFVTEKEMKLGAIHTVLSCPDAPFVVCMGGDNSSNNLKVMDLREGAPVRSTFGKRKLLNPLLTADFGFATADEAEPSEVMETETEAALTAVKSLTISPEKPKVSGGAGAKFKKKEKDKKKKNKF